MKKIITIVSASLLPLSALANNIYNFQKNNIGNWLYNWTTWLEAIIFIVCILFILYAAFLFITAGGDENKISTAKSIIVWAVIGIAVALLAFGITAFVTSLLA